MKKFYHSVLRVLTDILGVALIIAAIFFGWLPGIGGVPLFLAGLGLLAINNDWAKRWLDYVKKHGSRLADVVFANNPKLMWLNDIVAVLLVGFALYLLINLQSYLWRTAAFALFTLGLALFLGNRRRLKKLVHAIKKLRN